MSANGKRRPGVQEWEQVLACAKLIKEPNEAIVERLSQQLCIYKKIDSAVEEVL